MGNSALDASRNGTDKAPPSRRKLSPGPGLAAPQVEAHQLARIHDATIQLVADHGYENLKVRNVVRSAGVSTRAFYEHFGSKEDCFLQTYDLISRRTGRRIVAAQEGESDWRKRSRLVLEEFFRGLERKPNVARLALVEVYEAGDIPLGKARQAERVFGSMLAECLARTPGGIKVPPLVVEGMVAGIVAVSRRRLLAGELPDLWAAREELLEWALCLPGEIAWELAELDRGSLWRDTMLEPLPASFLMDDGNGGAASDRTLILTAVAELAATHSYAYLTAARVRSAARVSRRKFESSFDDLEDCYIAALERHAGKAMVQAVRAQAAARNWIGGVYRAITALCDHVASDPFLARVCLANDFPPGSDGARSRQRLIGAVVELFSNAAPRSDLVAPLLAEASIAATWSLFSNYTISNRRLHSPISATLSYLVLSPFVGAPAAISGIRTEQSA